MTSKGWCRWRQPFSFCDQIVSLPVKLVSVSYLSVAALPDVESINSPAIESAREASNSRFAFTGLFSQSVVKSVDTASIAKSWLRFLDSAVASHFSLVLVLLFAVVAALSIVFIFYRQRQIERVRVVIPPRKIESSVPVTAPDLQTTASEINAPVPWGFWNEPDQKIA